ncbi:MAG: tRNA uridine-5-carboxymethylaminomethyl(34) synthesis GTPase MnmE [Nevskia sp.]|nr:tRNA uridine-5-carboxymethylaminomethyl(34) synthesis GTPase MnmE [Nevskia sp.]
MSDTTAARTDTIAAIATPPGRGAVGVVRISGPAARQVGERIAGKLPAPRMAVLRSFRDAAGARIDQGLLLHFAGPQSYTGEDVVELQAHGGPAVLNLLLQATFAAGARPARPGEFSERAFLNGRMDLAQAEAVADLIEASSSGAARAALLSLQGEFSRRVLALLDELIALRADLEAALDFAEDVPWITSETLHERIVALVEITADLIGEATQGRRLREGMIVAIAGRPNVGKSTLLNRLAGVEAAIVSPHAGTTRDLLREHISVDGLPLTVVDTAGLRETPDPVEQEGVRRAWSALEKAELILYLADDGSGLTADDDALLAKLPADREILLLFNKCDLSGRPALRHTDERGRTSLRLSAATGEGFPLLTAEIKRAAGLTAAPEGIYTARARHLDALHRAQASLRLARAHCSKSASPELVAEELRQAQRALDEITGRFTTEDLLGRIFSTFCLGK